MSLAEAAAVRVVREVPRAGDLPLLVHPDWEDRWPWLVHGITVRGSGEPFDMGLFTTSESTDVQARWRSLLAWADVPAAVHARQVHGPAVRLHDALPPGLHLAPEADGHATAAAGLLLGVTVADCVPVWIVAPELPALAVVHAGWRGTAAGVLEAGLAALRERLDVAAAGTWVHLGPAICGTCYEVGPEVHEALGLPAPTDPRPVDLRAVLAERAIEAGVPAERITRSEHCTRCGDGPFFSHRGGDPWRHVAFAALRA